MKKFFGKIGNGIKKLFRGIKNAIKKLKHKHLKIIYALHVLSNNLLFNLNIYKNLDKIIIGDNMAVNFNEENIKDAINNGIDADAVNSTLDDMVNVSLETGKTPKQMKEVVESIVEMKKDTSNVVDEKYASSFVKENNQKIVSAINDGISPDEIAQTLVEATDKANDKKSRKHLKFITKLISKLKVKELKLRRDKENSIKGRQKVLDK